MFGSGQGSDSGMPPLVKSEPEEGLSMAGMYSHRTQAMDLAQDFPAVSAPLYDFHFPPGQPGLAEFSEQGTSQRHKKAYRTGPVLAGESLWRLLLCSPSCFQDYIHDYDSLHMKPGPASDRQLSMKISSHNRNVQVQLRQEVACPKQRKVCLIRWALAEIDRALLTAFELIANLPRLR